MYIAPSSDMGRRIQTSVPVYEPTLLRVQALKEDETYDELINRLIDTHEQETAE